MAHSSARRASRHQGYALPDAKARTGTDNKQLSALWAALATPEDSFIIVPFNILPSEDSGDAKAVEAEKQRIRDEILTKTNAEIIANDEGKKPTDKTITLLRALGSDLNINAFALNWRHPNGTVNTDVEEANYLMRRVVRRLSVDSPDDNPSKIPLYLTSTEFSSNLYGDCLANFKTRLGLEKSDDSMMVLRNVVMSPFASLSSKGDFINMLGETFKEVLEEEVKVSSPFSMARPLLMQTDLPSPKRGLSRLPQLLDARN